MKIAVIDTTIDSEPGGGGAPLFLPKLLRGLTARGNEVHFITKGTPTENIRREIEESNAILHTALWEANGFVEETAPVLAGWLNDLKPDIYLISASQDIGWVVLPLLSPNIATLSIGHADSENVYLPVRHYRLFLNRVIGATPEVCVGYVLSCVIEKEKVEWISDGEPTGNEELFESDENVLKMIENYETCFESAIADAKKTPRQTFADYPLMETCRSHFPLWLRKLKAKAKL